LNIFCGPELDDVAILSPLECAAAEINLTVPH
jgi:hypothetical protein